MLNPRLARLCVLCLAATVAACSGGGGDSDQPSIPWGRFRSGVANTAFAIGGLTDNHGVVSALPFELGLGAQSPGIDGVLVTVGGLTASTPIIGTNDRLYIGTTEGILVTKLDGTEIRIFNQCILSGTPALPPIPIGPVSGTPAINLNDDVIFGSDAGQVFAFHDDGKIFECLWVYPSPTDFIPNGVVSSPLILSDAIDRSQVASFLGIGSGYFQALNTFGTPQWRFPPGGAAFAAPLTSSAATDGVLFHVSAPDGFLYSMDRAGRLQHQARISVPITDSALLPSPMSGSSIYGIGLGGRCGDSVQGCLAERECSDNICGDLGSVGIVTALDQVDEVRWRFATDAPIAGSGAFVVQSIDEPAPPLSTPTPTTTIPVPVEGTPTPSPTRRAIVLEGVVYVVDNSGTVYGVKDVSGELFEARTTFTPTPTFVSGENTPTPNPNQPSEPSARLAKVQIEGSAGPVQVLGSPVLSSDLFVVFGTTDGEIYAVRLDYDRTVPCDNCDESSWDIAAFVGGGSGGGKVNLPVRVPIASSPIIDRDGSIFVTAGDISTGQGRIYKIGKAPETAQ